MKICGFIVLVILFKKFYGGVTVVRSYFIGSDAWLNKNFTKINVAGSSLKIKLVQVKVIPIHKIVGLKFQLSSVF